MCVAVRSTLMPRFCCRPRCRTGCPSGTWRVMWWRWSKDWRFFAAVRTVNPHVLQHLRLCIGDKNTAIRSLKGHPYHRPVQVTRSAMNRQQCPLQASRASACAEPSLSFVGEHIGEITFVLFFLNQDVLQHAPQTVFLEYLGLGDALPVTGNGLVLAC